MKKPKVIIIDSSRDTAEIRTTSDRQIAPKGPTARAQSTSKEKNSSIPSSLEIQQAALTSALKDAGHITSQQQILFPAAPTLSNVPRNITSTPATQHPYERELFGQLPPSNSLLQPTLGSPSFRPHNTSLPPYDPGFADTSNGAVNSQQQQQQQQHMQNIVQPRPGPAYHPSTQLPEHRSQSALPSLSFQHASSNNVLHNQSAQRADGTVQSSVPSTILTTPYERKQAPVIEAEDASEGRMLLIESAAAARRGDGEAPEDDDNVTEHYRGASSGIPSLHALRHHSDDGPAHLHKRTRAYSMSASHLRPGEMDYYAGTSSGYLRNASGYGDSLRTQADERGVFVEDERDHFTLPPIRLLSSHSSSDALGSPNFPVHVPKGLFDRLIS